MKALVLFFGLFLSTLLQATSPVEITRSDLFLAKAAILKADFDVEKNDIVLTLRHTAGMQHIYDLQENYCLASYPVKCQLLLIDTSDDSSEGALVTEKVRFNLSDFGLDTDFYEGAVLTICSANPKVGVVKLPPFTMAKPAGVL